MSCKFKIILSAILLAVIVAGVIGYFYSDDDDTDFEKLASTSRIQGSIINVHDGDTFTVDVGSRDIKIRLLPADAPELKQTCTRKTGSEIVTFQCGLEARTILAGMLGNAVQCELKKASYDRTAGFCRGRHTPDIGLKMVEDGYAWVDPRYATKEQQALMDKAVQDRLGFWNNGYENPKDGFQNPCEFRNPKKTDRCQKRR